MTQIKVERNLRIINWRRNGKTFEEIGVEEGISRMRVWQIYNYYKNRVQELKSLLTQNNS